MSEDQPAARRRSLIGAIFATVSMIVGFALLAAVAYRRLVLGELWGAADKLLAGGAFYLIVRGAVFWHKPPQTMEDLSSNESASPEGTPSEF